MKTEFREMESTEFPSINTFFLHFSKTNKQIQLKNNNKKTQNLQPKQIILNLAKIKSKKIDHPVKGIKTVVMSTGSLHCLNEMPKHSSPSGLMEGCPVLIKLSDWSVLPERLDCIHLVWQVSSVTQIMGTTSLLHLNVRTILSSWTETEFRRERHKEVLSVGVFLWSKAIF